MSERTRIPDNLPGILIALNRDIVKLLRKIETDPSLDARRKKIAAEAARMLLKQLFPADGEGVRPTHLALELPLKEDHYTRNRLMPAESLPGTPEEAMALGWDGTVAADCHQFTSPDRSNRKYVSPDGRSEVIFDKDGNTVTAKEDYGTYNFADPRSDPFGHFARDVLPWIIWGNTPEDSTDIGQRLEALIVYGDAGLLEQLKSSPRTLKNIAAGRQTGRGYPADSAHGGLFSKQPSRKEKK